MYLHVQSGCLVSRYVMSGWLQNLFMLTREPLHIILCVPEQFHPPPPPTPLHYLVTEFVHAHKRTSSHNFVCARAVPTPPPPPPPLSIICSTNREADNMQGEQKGNWRLASQNGRQIGHLQAVTCKQPLLYSACWRACHWSRLTHTTENRVCKPYCCVPQIKWKCVYICM